MPGVNAKSSEECHWLRIASNSLLEPIRRRREI
jgi:hypothetical protein